ncbi:unnamed protein product [Bursaphelenchus xylophilus]|uniref:(pine wood nematode) hypothetical protein n=1 Tax=Bursaphelenchus xylophilus TaxID=6326 RepID=A0A1I7SNU6_BURXY|nr:unnamed protein product [Bursaphelenchus xylophilus]CAG9081219.1 unnamed protein product [Bursaphelenchus xylophilus]
MVDDGGGRGTPPGDTAVAARSGELGVQPGQLVAGLTAQPGPGRKRNPSASSNVAPAAPGIPGGRLCPNSAPETNSAPG